MKIVKGDNFLQTGRNLAVLWEKVWSIKMFTSLNSMPIKQQGLIKLINKYRRKGTYLGLITVEHNNQETYQRITKCKPVII
jgi:hypothetical protein